MAKKIIFSVLLFIVIAGCTTSTKSTDVNLNVGFEGLKLEFSSNAPPPKVFEKSSFPVLMKIHNKGAYTIKDSPASIAVSFEKEYIPSFSLEANSQAQRAGDNEITFTLEGKTEINPNGDELLVELNAKTGDLEQQSELKGSQVAATMCYPYRTTLATTVCIDPDIVGIRKESKVCTVKDYNEKNLIFSTGQGAPLAVTKIESFMLAEADESNMRPQFLIFIENRGSGNPVNLNNYRNVCSSKGQEKTNDLWNVAHLRAFTSGNDELNCAPGQDSIKPAGSIKFRDGKDYVRCTFARTVSRNAQAYTSPLRIEIDYGYIDTTTAAFVIQKPLRH